tara:strand:- start:777 stop:1343 length:567 start_codon:yes stop_codon:yes gene_type:complete
MSMDFTYYDDFITGLNPSTAQSVQDFYFPSGDQANRGVPEYSGSSYNAYSNINPNAYSGSAPEEMGGDKLYADLIRAQTRDYLTRYAPVENFLASEVTTTGTKSLAGDMQRTRQAVLGSSQNVQGMQDRGMERFGLSNAPSNQNTMSTVSTMVGGLNATKAADVDRRTQLLSGSLGGISQRASSQGAT